MKINVSIAQRAKAITLAKYIDYQNAVDDIERVHVITGKASSVVQMMQVQIVDGIISEYKRALQLYATDFTRIVKFGAVEYAFIPNLSAMSLGEYVDIDTCASKLQTKDGELDGAMLHKLMCIFFRPIKYKAGKHYEIDKYDSDKTSRYANQLLQLDMEQVVNTLLFFSTLESELYNTYLSYLAKEMEAMMMEATQLHQTA